MLPLLPASLLKNSVDAKYYVTYKNVAFLQPKGKKYTKVRVHGVRRPVFISLIV